MMKKSTLKKIAITVLKSSRVLAWLVATGAGVYGFMALVGEPSAALGAGTEFAIAYCYQILLAIAMFIIAIGAGMLASRITGLFKRYGIK